MPRLNIISSILYIFKVGQWKVFKNDVIIDKLSGPCKTDWTPLRVGSSNIRLCKLVEMADGTVRVMPDRGALFVYGFFGAMGVALLFTALGITLGMIDFNNSHGASPPRWIVIGFVSIIGGCFLALSIFFIRDSFSGPIFDCYARMCKNLKVGMFNESKDISFSEVQAVQLISYFVSGDSDSLGYTSCQINLVLNDGSRLNVMAQGNLNTTETDAQTLAQLLHVPVWDNVPKVSQIPRPPWKG